jgi:hypothetical protein
VFRLLARFGLLPLALPLLLFALWLLALLLLARRPVLVAWLFHDRGSSPRSRATTGLAAA